MVSEMAALNSGGAQVDIKPLLPPTSAWPPQPLPSPATAPLHPLAQPPPSALTAADLSPTASSASVSSGDAKAGGLGSGGEGESLSSPRGLQMGDNGGLGHPDGVGGVGGGDAEGVWSSDIDQMGDNGGLGHPDGVGGVGGGDAEGVWSSDIDQAFQEALAIYPPCGRRKIILSDEGKMYGRNELIARYIKIRTGKTRTRKQVSSHIQVLARKKQREIHAKLKPMENRQDHAQKDKAMSTLSAMSSAQIISMGAIHHQLAAKNGLGAYQPPPTSGAWMPGAPESGGGPGPAPPFTPDYARNPYPLPAAFAPPPAAALPIIPQNPPLNPGSLYEGRSIWTPRFRLSSFSAYVDPSGETEEAGKGARHTLVRLDSTGISVADPPLETIELAEIADKFPKGRGGLGELFAKGPTEAFFLVKFWADINMPSEGPDTLYAADTRYESDEKMTITVSTKVISFTQQVVEKVETEFGTWDASIGKHVYQLNRSPMCEYMVKFVQQLRGLPEIDMMNSVLENFTILQVVTNKETRETLLCVALVFEISSTADSAYHLYKLEHTTDSTLSSPEARPPASLH